MLLFEKVFGFIFTTAQKWIFLQRVSWCLISDVDEHISNVDELFTSDEELQESIEKA